MARYNKSHKKSKPAKKIKESDLEKIVTEGEKTKLEPTSGIVELLKEQQVTPPLEETVLSTTPESQPSVQPSPSGTLSLKDHTLDNAADAESAVIEFLKANKKASFSRKALMDELAANTKVLQNARATELTKGGVKTGAGKPRWKKNVAWAIQRLYKSGQISKIGKNQYGINSNPKTIITATKTKTIVSNVMPKAKQMQVKPQINITIQQPAAKPVTGKVQEPADVKIENETAQPKATAATPNPPKVVEHVVEATREALNPKMMPKGKMDLSNVLDHVKRKNNFAYVKNPEIDDTIDAFFKSPATPPIMFIGPAGTGKTKAVYAFAIKNNIPLIPVQATPDTNEDQLLGHSTLENGNVVYEYGDIPKAIEAANQLGSAILLIDEFSLMKPEVQVIFNPITDFRKSIFINERKESFELKPGKKLLVIGTMNPPGSYGGGNPLQEAVATRFIPQVVEYPSLANERNILAENLKKNTGWEPEKDLLTRLITSATYTRGSKEGRREISPRNLENMLYAYHAFYMQNGGDSNKALEKAGTAIFSQYDEDPVYMKQVISKFNSNLKGYKGFKGWGGGEASTKEDETEEETT